MGISPWMADARRRGDGSGREVDGSRLTTDSVAIRLAACLGAESDSWSEGYGRFDNVRNILVLVRWCRGGVEGRSKAKSGQLQSLGKHCVALQVQCYWLSRRFSSLRHESQARGCLLLLTHQRNCTNNTVSNNKLFGLPEDWTCTICWDAFPASEKYCKIPDKIDEYHYRACATCLRNQFLSAQENEINYPVKWQKQILHPRQFPGAFNRTFVRAYEAKEVEFKAPALERVYCECGTFVAPTVDESARTSWMTLSSSKLCPGCEARWCLRCAQRCGGFGVPHDCMPERRLGERRLALGGLKKGRDFQICPGQGCGRMIELTEACNAMTCQCGASFCYICGEQAESESEHWLRADGGCPRYGAADSERAMFDDDLGHADDDAIANVPANHMEIWERGQGESTTFDFIRWAWQAAMTEGTASIQQLIIMYGDPEDEAQTIDKVRRAMEMYNPISHSGVSEEQWQELVKQHGISIEDWLIGLLAFNRSDAGNIRDYSGGALLDFNPRTIFNMAVAEDREAAALWIQQAGDATIEWVLNRQARWPESAVFDAGPGGASGEGWRIRDMDMFDDLPVFQFLKLAGGALVVRPSLQGAFDFVFGVELA